MSSNTFEKHWLKTITEFLTKGIFYNCHQSALEWGIHYAVTSNLLNTEFTFKCPWNDGQQLSEYLKIASQEDF